MRLGGHMLNQLMPWGITALEWGYPCESDRLSQAQTRSRTLFHAVRAPANFLEERKAGSACSTWPPAPYFRLASSGPTIVASQPCSLQKFWAIHEFHETCHSITFIAVVNSHQRWKQTWNSVCFNLCQRFFCVNWLWCCGVTASLGSLFFMK